MTLNSNKISAYPYLLLGSISGVILSLIITFLQPQQLTHVFCISYTALLLLSYPYKKSLKRLFLVTLIPALLLSLSLVYRTKSGISTPLVIFNALALNAFNIAYQAHSYKIPYKTLFLAVWDTIAKLLITLSVVLMSYALLFIFAFLFHVLNVEFFTILFTREWFLQFTAVFFSSLGVYISTSQQLVTRKLLDIIISICQIFLPALATMSLLFIGYWSILLCVHLSLPSIPMRSLLIITALAILLTNGVFQDGSRPISYSKKTATIVNIFLRILPIFPALSLIDLMQNYANYSYLYLYIYTLIFLAYTIGYSRSLFYPSDPWLYKIKRINICIAYCVIAICLIINNPFFPQPQPAIQKRVIPHNDHRKRYIAFKDSIRKEGFSWKPIIDDSAITFGFNPKPIYICKAFINQHVRYGVVDNNICHVALDNKIRKSSNFYTLSGNAKSISWQTSPSAIRYNKQIPFIVQLTSSWSTPNKLHHGGDKTLYNIFSFCRGINNNRIYVGLYSYEHNSCKLIAGNQLVNSPTYYDSNTGFLFFKSQK